MANTQGARMAQLAAGTTPGPGFVDGTPRCFVEEITLASQAIGDTIEVARLPKGAAPLYGVVVGSVSLGAATLEVGVAGTPGKYRAAATLAVTTPELFGVAGGVGQALSGEETVIVTIGAAALPASGTLRVMLVYAFN